MSRVSIAGLFTIATTIVVAQTPPRDVARITMTGIGGVNGSVVADDSDRRPLRHAIVTLSRTGVEDIRTTATDEQGAFVFDQLPAGTYSLAAAKGGYISASLGALQPGMPGTVITLSEGQRYDAATIALMKGAVIAGRLTDQRGHPVVNAAVDAAQVVRVNGEIRKRTGAGLSGTSRTNAHGDFRIFGLVPGDYCVFASTTALFFGPAVFETTAEEVRWGQQPTAGAPKLARPVTLAPTVFPGTTDQSGAVTLALGRGEVRTGIDFVIQYAPVSRVSGRVLAADGQPAAGVTVVRAPRISDPLTITISTNDRTRPDGTFAFANVAPGDFMLAAINEGMFWGLAELHVAGQDIDDAVIRLQPPIAVRGRMVMAGLSAGSAPDFGRVQLRLTRIGSNLLSPGRPTAKPDGTFAFQGVLPGLYRLNATIPPGSEPLFLQSATSAEKDIIDAPFEIRSTENVSDMVVTFSSTQSELIGTVTDRSGKPASQFYLLAFSEDPTFWTLGSRRVKAVRTEVNGRYSVTGLPSGNYYLCALTSFDKERQDDAAYLQEFIPSSLTITLGEGQRQTQDLRVGR